jgi:DNA-binding IclR family transcriptional regulator
VFVRPLSEEEQESIVQAGHSDQDRALRAMLDQPGRSLMEVAEHLGWFTQDGRPNKTRVHRLMKDLQKAKLVEPRRDGHYRLTTKGEKEAAATPEDLFKVLKEMAEKHAKQ